MTAASRMIDDLRARVSLWMLAAGALPIVAFAVLGWRRRWVSDDAFIDFRVVENLIHGYGPVFNAGERVEAYTSPLWTAILALLHGLFSLPLEWTAVVLGLMLTLAGVAAGMRGSLLLARSTGRTGFAVPVGALALIALRPMWDFATSGLETGLGFAWLGGTFWALVALDRREAQTTRRRVATAVLAGLGVVIRPDFGIFTVGFLVMLIAACGPLRRRTGVFLVLAALALPLAYQVFRMGYFAELVPNTAIAKEASLADWSRGWDYLKNFVSPYALWLPLVLCAALVVQLARGARRRLALLALIPFACGVVHAIYVVRVGGDFMHARLLLPALFGCLLPIMMYVPQRWRSLHAAAAVVIVGWAAVCGATLRLSNDDPLLLRRFQDERAYYVAFTGNAHPVTIADFTHSAFGRQASILRRMVGQRKVVLHSAAETLLQEPAYPDVPENPHLRAPLIGVLFSVGVGAYGAGPSVYVVDRYGLADPIAARLRFRPLVARGGGVIPARWRSGHEKVLPQEWIIARFADLQSPEGARLAAIPAVAAARRALGCGDLRRLLQAVDAPLSLGRFLSNIGDAFSLYSFRIAPDPRVAERELCRR